MTPGFHLHSTSVCNTRHRLDFDAAGNAPAAGNPGQAKLDSLLRSMAQKAEDEEINIIYGHLVAPGVNYAF